MTCALTSHRPYDDQKWGKGAYQIRTTKVPSHPRIPRGPHREAEVAARRRSIVSCGIDVLVACWSHRHQTLLSREAIVHDQELGKTIEAPSLLTACRNQGSLLVRRGEIQRHVRSTLECNVLAIRAAVESTCDHRSTQSAIKAFRNPGSCQLEAETSSVMFARRWNAMCSPLEPPSSRNGRALS
jgi:hypothetical protein